MKHILYILLIIFLSVSNTFSQESQTRDSLENKLSLAKEDTNKVKILQSLGLYVLNSDPEKSKKSALQIIELSKSLEYFEGVAAGYNLMALNEEQRGNYAKTIEYYFKALKIFEKGEGVKSNLNSAEIHLNIGRTFQLQQNYKQSSNYLNKALKYFEKTDNNYGIAKCYNTLGTISREQNNLEDALKYHSKALEFAKKSKNNHLIASISLNVAGDLDYKEDFDLVMESFNDALNSFIKMNDKKGEAIALNNIGAAYLQNEKYEEAIVFLLKSIEQAKVIKFKALISHNYFLVHNAYSLNKNYKKAYEYSLIFKSMTDSLIDESKVKIIAELETKYQVEKKEQNLLLQEKKIEILKKDKQIKAYTLYSLLAFIVLLIVSSLGWFRNYRNKKAAEEIEIRYQLDLYIKEIELLKKNNEEIKTTEKKSKENLSSILNDLLSERELEIFNELAKGHTNKEMAETLFVSVNTVKSHLKSIYEKLDVKNRTQAVQKWMN